MHEPPADLSTATIRESLVRDYGLAVDGVFMRPDLGAADHAEAVERFISLFEPGSIVDIALGSHVPG